MKKRFKETMRTQIVAMIAVFSSLATLSAWANDSLIYLDNRVAESINRDVTSLTLLVSYPGHTTDGVCSVEIITDSYHPQDSVQDLLDQLSILDAFDPRRVVREVEVVSDHTARFGLTLGTYVDGVILRSKDQSLTLSQVIEQTLGGQSSVVVAPVPCD